MRDSNWRRVADLPREQRQSILEALHVAAEIPDELLEERSEVRSVKTELEIVRSALSRLYFATIALDDVPAVKSARLHAISVMARESAV